MLGFAAAYKEIHSIEPLVAAKQLLEDLSI